MNETQRRDEWVHYLKALQTPSAKIEALAHIKRTEPKLIPGILRALDMKTPESVVEFLA